MNYEVLLPRRRCARCHYGASHGRAARAPPRPWVWTVCTGWAGRRRQAAGRTAHLHQQEVDQAPLPSFPAFKVYASHKSLCLKTSLLPLLESVP